VVHPSPMAGTCRFVSSRWAKAPGVVCSECVVGGSPHTGGEEAAIEGMKSANSERGWVYAIRVSDRMPGVAKGSGEELGGRVRLLPLMNRKVMRRR
jgi:hypothetical protein